MEVVLKGLQKSCGYASTNRKEGLLYVRSLWKVSADNCKLSRNKKPILIDVIYIFCNLKALKT